MQDINRTFTPSQADTSKFPSEASLKVKQPFTEPKLSFIVPKLVKQGSVEEITAGFFGSFYP